MVDHVELTRRAAVAREITDAVLAPEADTAAIDRLLVAARERTGSASAHLTLLVDRAVTGGVQGAFADQIQCGNETAYEDSFCANVLRLDAPLVISDAATDDRVATVPAVTDGMVGSYAGAPIRLPDVGIVAVLCVFDDHAREWSATEVADLTGLATEMADELQHYR